MGTKGEKERGQTAADSHHGTHGSRRIRQRTDRQKKEYIIFKGDKERKNTAETRKSM